MDHLSRLLKTSLKDLILVFPQNKRTRSALDSHFRAEGLPQVADWYGKRQTVLVKEELSTYMQSACEDDEFNDEWRENVSPMTTCTLARSRSEWIQKAHTRRPIPVFPADPWPPRHRPARELAPDS